MSNSKVKDLSGLLSTALGEEVEVLEQQEKNLTAPGENYGSIMLALDAKIRTNSGGEQELSLVAKLLPASELLKKAFDIEVTFRKEMYAYTTLIPRLIKFQMDCNVSPDKILNIFAKCYGGRISLGKDIVDEDAVLIFENLKNHGYQTIDRLVGFNLDESKVVLRDLAKFHAVPIAFRILRPQEFKEVIPPAVTPFRGFEGMAEHAIDNFLVDIITNGEADPDTKPYVSKIVAIIKDGFTRIRNKIYPEVTSPFATVVHNDFWINNTMILKNATGKTIANRIVDLQILFYESGLNDLVFFLFTSIITSVLHDHYDELIKLYYDTLLECLGEYNIDLSPFSWNAFLKDFDESVKKELNHIFVMLRPIFTERGKLGSMETFDESSMVRTDLTGSTYKAKLRDNILTFVARKWLYN